MQQWIAIKAEVVASIALDRDAIHVYAGLAGLFAAAFVLRRPISHGLPWLAVLVVELANEGISGAADGVVQDWEIRGSLHDLWNLMLAPTALLILARLAPGLFTRTKPQIIYQAIPLLEHYSEPHSIEDADFAEIEEER